MMSSRTTLMPSSGHKPNPLRTFLHTQNHTSFVGCQKRALWSQEPPVIYWSWVGVSLISLALWHGYQPAMSQDKVLPWSTSWLQTLPGYMVWLPSNHDKIINQTWHGYQSAMTQLPASHVTPQNSAMKHFLVSYTSWSHDMVANQPWYG